MNLNLEESRKYNSVCNRGKLQSGSAVNIKRRLSWHANMLCYWGLDSAIERGTIKASNLPGNRCCAGMSALCSMWENFFPWKNPPPFLFLCARGHNPDPKHGHHCDPKTRDCPIKSLPLLLFFWRRGTYEGTVIHLLRDSWDTIPWFTNLTKT